MASNKLKAFFSYLSRMIRTPQFLFLLCILIVGTYLRIWNIDHLFNSLHDYDEGAWSLVARFISEGSIPYRDFTFAHPPLHELVLAGIYKIFGYNFFYGRYLSVALSLFSIVLIYIIGKKVSHSGAGLIAAAFFAVSPDMIYFARRAVQESMAICLLLGAIYFLTDYLSNQKRSRLIYGGLLLGCVVATKYIFIPAVLACMLAIILIWMGKNHWINFKELARPSFLVVYMAFFIMIMSLLFILSWSIGLPIQVPFFSKMSLSVNSIMIILLVFIVPFIISILIMERRILHIDWWKGFRGILSHRPFWYLVGGIFLGFIIVTGFFWITCPHEFFTQTFIMHDDRSNDFPPLIAMMQNTFSGSTSSWYLRLAYLPPVLVIPLALYLFNKRKISQNIFFIAFSMLLTLIFCQVFPSLPRYSSAVYPFFILGLGCLVPESKQITSIEFHELSAGNKASILSLTAGIILFFSVSIVLLSNYSGYDTAWFKQASDEETVYQKTLSYVQSVSPQKIYATNPIYPALSGELKSSIEFDTFALLWLKKESPEEIIQNKINEGVDYVIVDAWTRYWAGTYKKQADGLVQAVREHGRLIQVIEPDSPNYVEIYLLTKEKIEIFNGDFSQWVTDGDNQIPLGWKSILTGENGDSSEISAASVNGKRCLKLEISENGESDGDREATYAGISQKIDFPASKVNVEILPTANSRATSETTRPIGIHFMAGGHVLTFGYSNAIEGEQVYDMREKNSFIVLRNARLGEWKEDRLDVAYYWEKAGWEQPELITMYFLDSAHYTDPGTFDFYIGSVSEEPDGVAK